MGGLTRLCSRCEKMRLYKNFRRGRTYCRMCEYKERVKWGQDNPDKKRAVAYRARAKQYGIVCDDINTWRAAQLVKQNGKCAMPDCENMDQPGRTERLAVDHDHVTGQPRALLCSRCNILIGLYEYARDRFPAFEGYLKQFEGVT